VEPASQCLCPSHPAKSRPSRRSWGFGRLSPSHPTQPQPPNSAPATQLSPSHPTQPQPPNSAPATQLGPSHPIVSCESIQPPDKPFEAQHAAQ
jgi:hypothetical protein